MTEKSENSEESSKRLTLSAKYLSLISCDDENEGEDNEEPQSLLIAKAESSDSHDKRINKKIY